MENITSLQIKNALERAKVDRGYGAELQKRLETGKYDSQLSELGIVRSPQGLKRISSDTQKPVTEPSFTETTVSDIQQRGQNIADIQQQREQGKSATMEALKMVSPELAAKVEPALSVAQKIKSKLGVGLDVAKTGQVAGAVNDVLGNVLMSIPGIKQAGSIVGKEISKVVPDVLAKAGIQTMEQYNTFAEQNPMIAKNLEGAVNIASLLPTGKAATITTEGIEQAGKQVGKTIGTATENVAEQVGKATSGAGKVVSDIVPTKSEFMSGQISKALDLTQGDLSNIKLATGNDVGDFIARNNLIGGSKDETIKAVKQLTDSQYKTVRDEIGKVKNIYSVNDIPKVKQSLSLLEKQLKGVPGLESTYKQVKSLAKKTTIELKDAQKVKELLDDQFSLFKATGDVKEGTIKKGLANVRKNIKEFIETEVKNTTGADIAQLNNDVSTGKSIMNLANKRSTREFTRANVSLSDLGAFGTGSMVATPLGGAAAVAVKRIMETPTVRLKIAKLINSLPKATQKAVQNELLEGNVPNVIDDAIKDYPFATSIKKNTTNSTKNASMPKASTKSATKSNDLSTDKGIIATSIENLRNPATRQKGSITIPGLKSKVVQGESYINDTTQSLLKEAKKYKSAEEFVNTSTELTYKNLQENPYSIKAYGKDFNEPVEYHRAGTIKKNGDIWLTDNPAGASQYSSAGGGTKTGSYVVQSKNPLIIDTAGGKYANGNIDITKILTKEEIAQGYTNNPNTKQKFIDYAKKNRYDAVQFADSFPDGEGGMRSLVVWDKSAIKTKSQLKDIWKKANKK